MLKTSLAVVLCLFLAALAPDAQAQTYPDRTVAIIEPIGSAPDQFAGFIASEMAKYGKIIRDADIKVE